MKIILPIKWFAIFCSFILTPAHSATDKPHPNVLFIAIDDMNDWAGFMNTHPQVKTPNMDALAAQGIHFTNAHAPAPICGPSRTAIMSGVWPSANGTYTNDVNYRKQHVSRISIPEYFRKHNYHVMGVGKIFHAGTAKMPDGAWDEYGGGSSSGLPFTKDELDTKYQKPFHMVTKGGKTLRLPLNGIPADRTWRSTHSFDWGSVDLPDELFSDTININWAIDKLQQKQENPFFLAVGFTRPHQPLFSPKRFHDMYPPESVVLPKTIDNDLFDLPHSGKEYALAANTSGLHKSVKEYGQWGNAVSSYLAAISFVDELIGNVTEALAKSPYASNTMIVIWSDNGWHLGEKQHWGKAAPWYRASRVPLIIIPAKNQRPEGFKPNSKSERMVNLLDLGPTLADMTNMPKLQGWQGNSLLPLLKNPDAKWQSYTHTTFGKGDHSIHTPKWEYIHYFDGTAELYDMQRDPEQFNNLANNSEYASVIAQLSQHLPPEPQWRYFVRYHNFKAVVKSDGSATSLYNQSFQNEVNEQNDIAKNYPHIVEKIESWLAETKPTSRYLSMTD
tara:strand:- start:6693 stop:8369 length:1677 start_codon:yes stop_codon:yes gene_type:complete